MSFNYNYFYRFWLKLFMHYERRYSISLGIWRVAWLEVLSPAKEYKRRLPHRSYNKVIQKSWMKWSASLKKISTIILISLPRIRSCLFFERFKIQAIPITEGVGCSFLVSPVSLLPLSLRIFIWMDRCSFRMTKPCVFKVALKWILVW